MAIAIADGFDYKGAKPLDARIKYATTAEMKSAADGNLYDGCMAYCVATDKYYKWLSSNSVDATLGRWREFSAGGEDSNAYHTDDAIGTTIVDDDYFPFYDTSVSTKKKSTWANLKSLLKKYFDTIYDLTKDDIPLYATCPTDDSTTRKIVTVVRGNFKRTEGAKIVVKFTYGNTAAHPELLINGNVYGIYIVDENGNRIYPTEFWNPNDVVTFIFDGTYLIMQPTISMNGKIPAVGIITRSDLYSTTEKVIGCWTDGRPIYQKTINAGALPNSTSKTFAHGISNINQVVNATAMAMNTTANRYMPLSYAAQDDPSLAVAFFVDRTNVIFGTAYDWSGFNATYVTLHYTKTTDAANSYNYADTNDYSTSEKIVGTWVDGSYLYQRTITGNTASSGTTTNVVALNPNYFVRKFEGTIRQDTGVYAQIGYSNAIEGEPAKDAIFAFTDGGYVKLMQGEYNRNKPYGLTIQYTK